ncbi:MAG: transglycosylase SLT domain-containing protein [Rhodobacteraceae bacterium]|nr:transglycosylase SLT domain-containing protein [Paracoccaceae bacterium]MCP5341320.1 transglycosylase SLT domain-containing protein [Paracoccaceae bacterium]
MGYRPLVWRLLAIMGVMVATVLPAVATATADLSVICDHAATEASRRTGVPVSVLRAISLTETGRRHGGAFRPWPWTVNMEGKGIWFDSEPEARAYVDKAFAQGARSFDVGCFQINYKWHGEAFRSIEEMFDPLTNALYAARFLQSLREEKGSWSSAAGAYHSRNAKFADKYQARFDRIRNTLLKENGQDIPEIPDIVLAANGAAGGESLRPRDAVARINRFPFLQTGTVRGLGSLVPLNHGSATSLFGPPAPVVGTD